MMKQVSLNGRRMVTCGALVSYPGRFSLVITNLEARRVPVMWTARVSFLTARVKRKDLMRPQCRLYRDIVFNERS